MDEGPGLSGTSFRAVAEELSAFGVPDERIVFFPSWVPDGAALVSDSARERWRRHRKVTASFEEVWTDSGRLGAGIVDGSLRDVSAGEWRRLFWDDEEEWPAVQPQHERRKYLAAPSRSSGRSGSLLLKFAGFGGVGRRALERAEALAAMGFGPPVHGLADGFLVHSWVEGRPVSGRDVDPPFVAHMAGYVARLAKEFPTGRAADFDGILRMLSVNVAQGIGKPWAAILERLERFRPVVEAAGTVAVDGRMLPHEWLRTADGWVKTDGVDHHDDHFWPGCQDPAWDLAAVITEFRLRGKPGAWLLESYVRESGDRSLAQRIPFYLTAYMGYRLGYATMGARALGASPDAGRLMRQATDYALPLPGLIRRVAKWRFKRTAGG